MHVRASKTRKTLKAALFLRFRDIGLAVSDTATPTG